MIVRKAVAVDETHFPPHRMVEFGGTRYRFGHQIGVGAFSAVFEAQDEWGHPLAVKAYHPEAAPDMWRVEARQLGEFSSPHIVRLHAAFQCEGQAYLVMERCGIGVRRLRFRTNDERAQACRVVARGLLHALHVIHRKGHLHGDINPENVLARRQGNALASVTLVDFALSGPRAAPRAHGRDVAMWAAPPEFHDPALGPIDVSSDIYHASLVLLGLLAGHKDALYERGDVLADRPREQALAMNHPLASAIAAGLVLSPSARPSAPELWRAILRSARPT